MLEQSVSKGTLEDVVQLVHRDFAAAQVDAAFALLGAHEASNPARVRLAALKCANGDVTPAFKKGDFAGGLERIEAIDGGGGEVCRNESEHDEAWT